MQTPINAHLEKMILAGSKIISIDSETYNSENKEYTHVLIECPANYIGDLDNSRPVKFMYLGTMDGKWLEMVHYYGTKRQAEKSYKADLTEDRRLKRKSIV